MRIISGKHKSRRITAPKKLPVRPTTDMAKEALFNILNNEYYFDEVTLLDLFSGTGNISYEFGSRGTTKITTVDGDAGCVDKTAKELDLTIDAIKSDVFSFLEKTTLKSDVIFADPPYDLPLEDFEKIPELVFEKRLLLEEGVLIIEHAKQMKLDHLSHFSKARKYGGSVFSFFAIPISE